MKLRLIKPGLVGVNGVFDYLKLMGYRYSALHSVSLASYWVDSRVFEFHSASIQSGVINSCHWTLAREESVMLNIFVCKNISIHAKISACWLAERMPSQTVQKVELECRKLELSRNPPDVRVTNGQKPYTEFISVLCITNFCATVLNISSKEIISFNTKCWKQILKFV